MNAEDRYGSTPLHLACQVGNYEGVCVLLESDDIKLNAKDGNGDTPLHEACFHGKVTITKKLLDKMKESEVLNLAIKNAVGLTPFHLACQKGHVKIAKLLLDYPTDQSKRLVMAVDSEGETPLHLACQNDNNEMASLLLEHNADVFAPNNDGIISVHIAARYGCLNVMRVLLSHPSVDPKDAVNTTDNYDQTPLHFAAESGKKKMMELLLEKYVFKYFQCLFLPANFVAYL